MRLRDRNTYNFSELSREDSAAGRDFSPHLRGDCSRQRRVWRRRVEPLEALLDLPVVRRSAPNHSLEGKIGWLDAVAYGGLDAWRQEAKLSAGANMGIKVSGASGNLAERDALPQQCHPAVCIGQGPRKGAIWCGGVVAGDDYGFETAAAQTERGGDFADVGGEIGFRDGEHSRQAGWFNPGKVSEIETSSHSPGSTVEWEVREL